MLDDFVVVAYRSVQQRIAISAMPEKQKYFFVIIYYVGHSIGSKIVFCRRINNMYKDVGSISYGLHTKHSHAISY